MSTGEKWRRQRARNMTRDSFEKGQDIKKVDGRKLLTLGGNGRDGGGQQDRDHVEGGGPQKVQMWKVLKDIFCSNIGRSRDRTEKSPGTKISIRRSRCFRSSVEKKRFKKVFKSSGLEWKASSTSVRTT